MKSEMVSNNCRFVIFLYLWIISKYICTNPLNNNLNPDNKTNGENISGDQNGQDISTPTQSNTASSRNSNRSNCCRAITANTSTSQRAHRRRSKRTIDNLTVERSGNNMRQRHRSPHNSIEISGLIDEINNG